MIVVVGGQARKVGKTTVMCRIISATKELGWTAVKLTSHRHGGSRAHQGDTERYMEAGAARGALIHSPDDLPGAANLIIESNAVLDTLTPDLFVFVVDPSNPQWKDSARRVFPRADIVVDGGISDGRIDEIVAAVGRCSTWN
jgi:hypothetical protein